MKTSLTDRILCPPFTNNGISLEAQGPASFQRPLGIKPSEYSRLLPPTTPSTGHRFTAALIDDKGHTTQNKDNHPWHEQDPQGHDTKDTAAPWSGPHTTFTHSAHSTLAVHRNPKHILSYRLPGFDSGSQGQHAFCPLCADEDTGTLMRGTSLSLSESGQNQDLDLPSRIWARVPPGLPHPSLHPCQCCERNFPPDSGDLISGR